MIEVCDCTGEFAATGLPVCDPNFGEVEKLIWVPLVANDGTRNYIDLTVAADQAFWEGKVNESDESKRFYPFPLMEEVSNERAETTKQTFASGNSLPIKQGVKPFSGFHPLATATFKKEAEGVACRKGGFYQVDGSGSVRGNISADGTKLYPTPIQHKSLELNYVEATSSTVEGITMVFEWKRSANDGDFKIIKADEMDGFDVTELGGELNVNGLNPTAIGLTGHSIELTSNYGSAGNNEPIKGLVLASFEIFNQTTVSVIVPSGVVEAPDGTYTFTYAAQTASDVIETRIVAVGYQDSAVRAATVTL